MPTKKTKEDPKQAEIKEIKKVKEVKETKKVEEVPVVEPEAVDSSDGRENPEEVFDVKKIKDPKKYYEAVGRRKTAKARVRLFTQGKKGIVVNGRDYKKYFSTLVLQKIIREPMEKLKCEDKFGFTIITKGGGPSGQAEACRHGIARSLEVLNPYFRKRLKKAGFLTRDPRMRERKKPGLKRARRAPQWSKR